ncbi:MAG: ATP-binding protein [bacterium]|nr:ATP-binding protein [bacterium]
MTVDLFIINKVLVTLIDITAISLGYWVYFSNPKRKLNEVFIGMVFFMMLWVNFAYLARAVGESNPYLVLLFLKIAWFATPLFFILLYILALHLLDENFKYKTVNLVIIYLAIVTSFVVGFTDHIVKSIKFMGVFLIRLVYGDWMFPFLIVITLFIIVTLQVLFKKYYSGSKKDREKISYYLLGILVFYIANSVFNIFFPIVLDITRFYFLGDYSTIILLGLIAYAIVRQNLFGIKIVLTSLLVGFISILLTIDIFLFTESHVLQFFKGVALIVFLYLGRELVKSVLKEEERSKQLEKVSWNLTSANQKLQDLLSMKNDFLHIVSHQLRTPLTAMRGFISMWSEGILNKLPAEKMAEIKTRIVNNSERLNNIVNDMVLAMESEGELKVEFKLIDIKKLIAGNVEMLKPNFEKKNLYLKYNEVTKNIPKIEADEKLLFNVFMNLADNAEKYTDNGGLNIEIGQNGDDIRVSFIDTGVGLNKNDKKILFKKFSRGAKSNYINTNGSGLGLFIAKQIVRMHRGTIKAFSRGEGKGSTFTVILPIKQKE